MTDEIYLLDLLGTFAFASYGSYLAIKKDFDVFGIFVCAFLTAVGGGTIREVILGNIPFYFYDGMYIAIIIIAMLFTIAIYHYFHRIKGFILVLDAIGLVTFAFIGASKANDLHIGIFGITFFATITAVGGGILRDLIMNEVPEIMHRDFYATVAVLLGLLYATSTIYMSNPIFANLLIASCLLVRLAIMRFKINLWKPMKKQ